MQDERGLGNDAVDAFLLHIFIGRLSSFRSLEFGTAGSLEDGTAHLNDVGYVLRAEFHNFAGYQTTVSSVDTFYFDAVEDGRTSDGADGSIHARSITAGSQNTNAFN